jgi:hypothetical protein
VITFFPSRFGRLHILIIVGATVTGLNIFRITHMSRPCSHAVVQVSGEARTAASTPQDTVSAAHKAQRYQVSELRACTASLKHAIAAHVKTIHHDLLLLQRGNEKLFIECQKHSSAALAVSAFVSVRIKTFLLMYCRRSVHVQPHDLQANAKVSPNIPRKGNRSTGAQGDSTTFLFAIVALEPVA